MSPPLPLPWENRRDETRETLRHFAVAILLSVLLHLVLLFLLAGWARATPPPEEQEVFVPLALEPPPESPPEQPRPPAPPAEPARERQEKRQEPRKGEEPPEERSLLGWNSRGEIEGAPDRPPGPEAAIHAPPKPGGGPSAEEGPEVVPDEGKQREDAETGEPREGPALPEPRSLPPEQPPLPAEEATPDAEPTPVPAESPPDAASEELPGEPAEPGRQEPEAPAAGATPPTRGLPPLPRRLPERPVPTRPNRPPGPGRAPDFDAEIDGGMFGSLRFDSKDYDWSDYSTKVYFAIYRAWLRELYGRVRRFERDQKLRNLPTLDGEVKIHFVLHRDGSVSDVQVISPSVLPALDDASAAALVRAVLPPLPADFPRDREGLTFLFEISGFPSAYHLEQQLRWRRMNGEF